MITRCNASSYAMFKGVMRSIIIANFAMISSLSVQGQLNPSEALLSESGMLTLPQGVEQTDLFTFDLSSLLFDSEQKMVEFMSQFNNEFFLFRCNPSENKGIVMLQTKGREHWTREQWNAVLADCCVQKPIVK